MDEPWGWPCPEPESSPTASRAALKRMSLEKEERRGGQEREVMVKKDMPSVDIRVSVLTT